MSFFFNHINAIIDISIEIPVTIANPCISFENGNGTFIPQILAINVGNDKTIVIDANNFITTFRLFEITEAYASIVPLRMSLYIFPSLLLVYFL